MHQLTINPKNGGTIKFGKLPLFSKNLVKALGVTDFSSITQYKTNGRYFAIELSSANAPQETQPAQPTDTYQSKKIEVSLEDLGFVNISSAPKATSHTSTPHRGKPFERGNLSLFEWLKNGDYVIYKLFVFENGEVALNRVVDYDDICLLFIEAGLEDGKGKRRQSPGRAAQNVANMSISHLLNRGVLQKASFTRDGRARYRLTAIKGGNYAQGVYRTVRAGSYAKDSRGQRVHHA